MHNIGDTGNLNTSSWKRNNMKNTESNTVERIDHKLHLDGVTIHCKPQFKVYRSPTRKFYCKDDKGRVIAEFVGMAKLTGYVCKETGKKPTYVKQRVYKALNKKVEFLGYYWSDK